ncbi:MAG: sodium-dependent bicarbonate transport family permease [Candidatus Kapabacteria bacterium]|nr:sodium-dependent bicarbonate transport family permease [Candidatus Kapabacteria bacterium]
MIETLLEPLPMFFVLGLIAGFLKSDLKLPEAIYDILSTYLLLSIGLKGGTQLAKIGFGGIIIPALGTLAVGIITPLIAFAIIRSIGKLGRADSAALAAHYGSVSAVTFAVIQSYLDARGITYEGYMAVLLMLLEIPAIIVAIVLARLGDAQTNNSKPLFSSEMLHEVFLNRGVYLLVGGLFVGTFAGKQIAILQPVFKDAFPGLLAFFLLEMGIVASRRLSEFRSAGKFLVVFALTMPLISASIGAVIGAVCGLSLGGTAVLTTMAASASYIAATAAMRIAVPEANPTYYVTTALGITFPFNIAIGLALYVQMAEIAHQILR